MDLNTPQDYLLELEEGSYKLTNQLGACSFSKPSTVRGLAKLYTVSAVGKLYYVGIAEQPMAARLRFGFQAIGKNGYHGYKWKGLRQRLALSVWTAHIRDEDAKLRDIETVEAEVAFVCRAKSGQWPEYQHEIHFFPSNDFHRTAALRIFEHATQRQI